MTDAVHRFFSRLSPEATERVLAHVGLTLPDLSDLGPRKRIRAVLDLVFGAGDDVREQLEGIAGQIVALADQGEFTELALRAVCEGRQELLERLEEEWSLEERILSVSFEQPALLDIARNLAMTFHWKEGRRYHAGFTVGNPQQMNEDIKGALEAIRSLVQSRPGGRKVYTETFTYTDPSQAERSKHGSTVRVHHIAIYLEAPAKCLLEFKAGHPKIASVVRREAKEMAIEYCPSTGRLDVVGRGVGGAKVFHGVADVFRAKALSDAPLTELKYEEWPLGLFLQGESPKLTPPSGFSSVRVTRIFLRSQRDDGGRAEFGAGAQGTAFDRMRALGVRAGELDFEWASSVTLTLVAVPPSEEEQGQEVRATLSWPNGLTFAGAGVKDRRVITEWLRGPALAGLHPPK